MNKKAYLPRICDWELQKSLNAMGAVLIEGAKWCGKTSTAVNAALRMSRDYVEAIIHQDISRVDGVAKNPNRVRLLLRSLARNITTMASVETIVKDVEATETSISDKTFANYYNALRRIFVIEDMPAWSPLLRSKTAIRTSPKHHFVDPSIATAVMRLN
ncbi:hypothetical protein FACS189467_0570 [Bacteroidia bacterium]|nr:hypothetical protein FACS189467_0570 [Bacteroidia bacterium]